jgi:hypothetical protein
MAHHPLPLPRESAEQQALFTWAAFHEARDPRLALLVGSANGELRPFRVNKKGRRYSPTGAKLQVMGVRKGFPDIALYVYRPRTLGTLGWCGHFFGMFLELKRLDGGKGPSQDQIAWLDRLRQEGYFTSWCAGWVEAAKLIAWYLDAPALLEGL